MPKKRKNWTHSEGKKPFTVTVYERTPEGPLYARIWDPTKRSGKGDWIRRSLGHRDTGRAIAYAQEQSAKLRKGHSDLQEGKLTLLQVFALYRRHRTPRKSEKEQLVDLRRIEMWTHVLGAEKDPHQVSLADWEGFYGARTTGRINARGEAIPMGDRLPVRNRVVESDLQWLRWVFNWASKWRMPQGHYVMRENPVRGYEAPKEKNPKRPIATQDRFEATRAVSDQITMEVRRDGKREIQRSYLSELLDIINGTGRRVSAVLQLRYEDLRLSEGPHGSIRWPAETDKTDRETTIPLNPQARKAIDRVLRERPGIGRAPVFPNPIKLDESVAYYAAARWLRKAEELAGLAPLEGSLWHAYRRKWATERKHLPDVDVAAAGGWKNAVSLKTAYQQADSETILKVVLGAGELREARQ